MSSSAWKVFGGIAFTDSAGSTAYEDAFCRAMEALRAEFSEVGQAWFDHDRFGDLTLLVIFRRSTRTPQTRVSIGDRYVEARRSVPTKSYFGLSREAMLVDACSHIADSLSAVARKLDLADPPLTGSDVYERIATTGNSTDPR